MDYSRVKIKARELRKQGKTYSEIQRELAIKVPKSTLSFWLHDIPQSVEQLNNAIKVNKSNLNLARGKAREVNLKKRKSYLNELKERNFSLLKKVDKSVQKIMLAILYLGEGGKYKSSKKLSFTNSNGDVIKFFLILLKNNFQIVQNRLRVRIQCRYDQNITELETYWQNITSISAPQFYPTYVDKRTMNKPTLKKDYRGVCSIYYHSTEIQLELEILASSLMEHVIIST